MENLELDTHLISRNVIIARMNGSLNNPGNNSILARLVYKRRLNLDSKWSPVDCTRFQPIPIRCLSFVPEPCSEFQVWLSRRIFVLFHLFRRILQTQYHSSSCFSFLCFATQIQVSMTSYCESVALYNAWICKCTQA